MGHCSNCGFPKPDSELKPRSFDNAGGRIKICDICQGGSGYTKKQVKHNYTWGTAD